MTRQGSVPHKALARVLFEEMERLAPGPPGGPENWDSLPEWHRLLYVNCVERLLPDQFG
jgi:hypothetical protein